MNEKSIAERLAQILDRECSEERLAAVIGECLGAMTVSRSGVREPDYRTRLQAASLALAYRHGTPTKREEIRISAVPADSTDDLEQRLARSPALRKSLLTLIAQAEGRPPIDV